MHSKSAFLCLWCLYLERTCHINCGYSLVLVLWVILTFFFHFFKVNIVKWKKSLSFLVIVRHDLASIHLLPSFISNYTLCSNSFPRHFTNPFLCSVPTARNVTCRFSVTQNSPALQNSDWAQKLSLLWNLHHSKLSPSQPYKVLSYCFHTDEMGTLDLESKHTNWRMTCTFLAMRAGSLSCSPS